MYESISKGVRGRQPITYLGEIFTPPHFSIDEQRKRGFLALFLLTICPALLFFGLLTFASQGMSLQPLLIAFAVLVGVTLLLALRYVKNVLPLFRLGVLFIVSLLSYEMAVGGGEGTVFLWLYFHPVAAFFLFGIWEGLFWVLASWLSSLLLLVFNLGPYNYELAVSLRFMVTYTLVSILAYGLESSRAQYYDQLLREKAALETALQQVKTLRALLPICASCKKIRDDAGYWHSVESYIGQHMAVEFSHSVCPECRVKLYGILSHQIQEAGKSDTQ